MVTVKTRQEKRTLTDEQARRAEALHRYLADLASQLDITLADLKHLGFTAKISISDVHGDAPGN
jgi:hypothetical protein